MKLRAGQTVALLVRLLVSCRMERYRLRVRPIVRLGVMRLGCLISLQSSELLAKIVFMRLVRWMVNETRRGARLGARTMLIATLLILKELLLCIVAVLKVRLMLVGMMHIVLRPWVSLRLLSMQLPRMRALVIRATARLRLVMRRLMWLTLCRGLMMRVRRLLRMMQSWLLRLSELRMRMRGASSQATIFLCGGVLVDLDVLGDD